MFSNGLLNSFGWGPQSSYSRNLLLAPWMFIGLLFSHVGCGSNSSGVTQTDTKTQIERLFNLYKSYVDTKQKGPADEKALKEYAKTLSEKQLDELLIGKDVESIFVSPRDKEPFQIVYGQTLSGGGEPVAIIYEKTGQNGLRYASLSMGYSEEYDAETLNGYLPKKK